jgi:hypothetical protein
MRAPAVVGGMPSLQAEQRQIPCNGSMWLSGRNIGRGGPFALSLLRAHLQ